MVRLHLQGALTINVMKYNKKQKPEKPELHKIHQNGHDPEHNFDKDLHRPVDHALLMIFGGALVIIIVILMILS